MISIHSTISISPDQVSCDLNGEAVILNLKSGMYYGLDPVGARVWNLIQTAATVEEVRDALVTDYEVERERCEEDLLLLLDRLAAAGLIRATG